MSTETNKQMSRNLLECIDKLDFDSWRATLAPQAVGSVNGGETMNREQFEGMCRGMMAAFSNGRHIIDGQVAEGDWVTTRLTWTAMHVGEFNGVPASNRPVRVSGAAYDRFEDGKIVEHLGQFDTLGLMIQIGALPVPA